MMESTTLFSSFTGLLSCRVWQFTWRCGAGSGRDGSLGPMAWRSCGVAQLGQGSCGAWPHGTQFEESYGTGCCTEVGSCEHGRDRASGCPTRVQCHGSPWARLWGSSEGPADTGDRQMGHKDEAGPRWEVQAVHPLGAGARWVPGKAHQGNWGSLVPSGAWQHDVGFPWSHSLFGRVSFV